MAALKDYATIYRSVPGEFLAELACATGYPLPASLDLH